MKEFRRSIVFCLISIFALCTLCSCAGKKKTVYQSYVQNLLDVNYKGIYTNYIKENGGKEADADNMHLDCVNQLAEQLISHYSLDNAQSLSIKERFLEIAELIYSKTNYSVSESYHEGSDYYVDVTIYPANVLNQSYDDIIAYIDQFNADVDAGVYNNHTKEQYEETFAKGLADILERNANSMEYLDPVTIKVAIIDDGTYYSISAEDLISIDRQMIAVETFGADPDADGSDADSSEVDDSSEE